MLTDQFDYPLPEASVAQVPAEPRDSARLLVDRGNGSEPTDHHVRELESLVEPGTLIVANDTRVLPGRIPFTRPHGGASELLLLEPCEDLGSSHWEALVRPSRKLPEGSRVDVSADLTVEFGEDLGGGRRIVRLEPDGDLLDILDHLGEMPVPPYLQSQPDDPERYQTVYARRAASAAAPTAGLHLTHGVLDGLAANGVEVSFVELVVGVGTFRPMTTDRVEDHHMHSERYRIPEDTWEACHRARAEGRPVLAIGTTSARALEAAAATGELAGRTDLFIHRPYPWGVVDRLLTNFHLPRSSLLVLLDAFIGDRWRTLYEMALRRGYRFLSFGDAMLVDRSAHGDAP